MQQSRLVIGGLELSSRVLVAPMAGITDVPFRRIASCLGAGLVTTEMVSAEAVVRSNEAAIALLDFPADTDPVAAQVVGCDPSVMAAAAQLAVERGARLVDVNLGCPVRKVVGIGNGAALARDIAATAKVLSAMVRAVPVPVTAKMRLGWDHSSINAPELGRALEGVGVAAVTVHGRTRAQAYQGRADWGEIARVKEAVGIPVIGSGDVDSPEVAAAHVAAGDVDGVVLARGMLGDFHMIQRVAAMVDRGEQIAPPPFAARISMTAEHLSALCDYYGEHRALRIGRKYLAWTIKGCKGAARLRSRVQDVSARADVDELLTLALESGPREEGVFLPIFTSGEG